MKITKKQIKQIIKEELENVLNEYGDISHDLGERGKSSKAQEWEDFAEEYGASFFEKDGKRALYLPGHQGDIMSPTSIRAAQAIDRKAGITMHEGDITIVTNIPASAGASNFDPDGDGDVDKLDPDAVRRAIGMGSDNLEYY